MKKIITCIILASVMLLNTKAFAAASPPPVVADGALLIDANSGKILFERNKDEKFYPASTTKIMTALLVLEKCKLDDKVIVGKKPSSFVDGNKIYIFQGEEFTVDQLLNALLIESANDVAIALAEHVSGTEEAFAQLMTERAKQLGCKNTNFVNSHGLYDPNHYTTAYDLSLIAQEAMKNEEFRKIITTKFYVMPPTNKQPKERPLSMDNLIVLNSKYHVDGANGIKMGYTSEAGHSFVGSAARGDMNLIVVLLHDKKPGLWEDAQSLLNYGFNSFKTIKKVSAGDVVTTLKVKGTKVEIPLTAEKDLYYTYPADETPDIQMETVITGTLSGMILKGQKIGAANYSVNGTNISSIKLIAGSELPSTILYSFKNDKDGNIKKAFSTWLLVPLIGFITFGILTALKYQVRKKIKKVE